MLPAAFSLADLKESRDFKDIRTIGALNALFGGTDTLEVTQILDVRAFEQDRMLWPTPMARFDSASRRSARSLRNEFQLLRHERVEVG